MNENAIECATRSLGIGANFSIIPLFITRAATNGAIRDTICDATDDATRDSVSISTSVNPPGEIDDKVAAALREW